MGFTMRNKIQQFFKQLFCQHTNQTADTQIKVIQCDDCKRKVWYKVQDIYSAKTFNGVYVK